MSAEMDRLPDLASLYRLDTGARAVFASTGHAVVRGLASPEEVAAFRPALLEAGEASRFDRRPLEERDTYGRAFVQMFNLWRHSERAKAFIFAHRFAAVAAELLGVPAVRLYHDQALFKEPGGGFTPWHQDQFYWPLDTDRTITMWMPLCPVTPEMGPMTFASGSNREGHLGDLAIGEESQRVFAEMIAAKGLETVTYDSFAPGDASFHTGWTLHSAPENTTDVMREVVTVIYFADGARVAPLDHPNRRFDRDTWLPGCAPGELAASPLNPVL
jgi:ectoine hydroxylase-related dioxygenase (phytanoyl-CoA dioxygenase family)